MEIRNNARCRPHAAPPGKLSEDGDLRPSRGSTTSIGSRFHRALGYPKATFVDNDGVGLLIYEIRPRMMLVKDSMPVVASLGPTVRRGASKGD